MKLQELSAGDIFYTCWASNKKVLYGPYRLEGRIDSVPIYKATSVVDRSTRYLPGNMECLKMGSTPDADR